MLKTVHKFKVTPGVYTWMPKDAEPLSVGQQGADIVCWALVHEGDPADTPRQILGAGTGHTIPMYTGQFLGTVQMDSGLVFHFFDLGAAELPTDETSADAIDTSAEPVDKSGISKEVVFPYQPPSNAPAQSLSTYEDLVRKVTAIDGDGKS